MEEAAELKVPPEVQPQSSEARTNHYTKNIEFRYRLRFFYFIYHFNNYGGKDSLLGIDLKKKGKTLHLSQCRQ